MHDLVRMSGDDLIDRFAGDQMAVADIVEYTPVALATELEELWGRFTKRLENQTGYYTWRQVATAMIDHAAHLCA